mgnify:CR=1 FL=1
MSLINLWRVRNNNRANIQKVIRDLGMSHLNEDELFLVRNTFEIAPYQNTTFEQWISGFEERYSIHEIMLMQKSWHYSIIEFSSHAHI